MKNSILPKTKNKNIKRIACIFTVILCFGIAISMVSIPTVKAILD
jgi:hypothetical protein